MDKNTHSLGTMDDLRKSGGKSHVSFSKLPNDERASMIGKILDHFGYAHLSREDKGIVRVFLQSATGYSRAQVARYITTHLHTVRYYKPEVISFGHNKWKRRMFPALTLALLLLLSGAIDHQTTGDVLNVLNAERTTGSGEVTSGATRTMIVRAGNTELLAIHEEPGETLVTWSLNALLQRVDARRIARLRLNASHSADDGSMAARPDIGIEKEMYPAYAPTGTIHAAANDPWDIPASGVEGQILMIKNGKPVWHDFPYLEQIRNQAPHGTEGTTRAGGNRSGGSENTVENNTTNTTIIQQVGGGSAPSGWTDNGPFVFLTDDTASVGIGTETPEAKLEVAGSISGATLYIGGSISGASLQIDGAIAASSLNIVGAITGSSLYIGATIDGAGLTSCNSLNSKLVWNAATKQFECGVDQTVGTGLSQATGDERYLQKQGGTMTGALTIRITGGNKNTIGLNVINSISGAVIHAQNTLSSSGTLVWEGAGSGSSLYIASSLQGAGLADCDLSTQKLQWDITSGRFSCGTDLNTPEVGTLSFSGAVIRLGNTQYVKKSGDTMTGALVINVTGGTQNTLGLRVINTLSGAVLHAEKSLTTSGALAVEGDATVEGMLHVLQSNGELRLDNGGAGNTFTLSFYDGTQRASISNNQVTATFSISTENRLLLDSTDYINISGSNYVNVNNFATFTTTGLGLGTSSPETPLEVVGIGSGTVLYASSSLRSSGSLVWEGAGSGSSLYIASSLQGVGLVDCDIAGTSKLLWDSSTGRFSCGTDTDTNTTYTAARGLTLNGTAFSLNSTITGALVRFTTISGSIITAKTSLASSGSLTWEGAASGATLWVSSLDGAGLTDCDAANQTLNWDDMLNRFTCGTDSDTTYTAAQGLTLNGSTFSLNSTITGALVRFTTISGSIITAKTSLASSGSLTWEGAGSGSSLYIASSLQGVGLTDCDAASQVLKWDATSGRFSCGTATNNTFGSGNVIAIGDSKYVNVGGDTMTGALAINVTGGSQNTLGLRVINTASGAVFHAEKSLTSSGTLQVAGAARFGNNVNVAGAVSGSSLRVDNGGNATITLVGGSDKFNGIKWNSDNVDKWVLNNPGTNDLRLYSATALEVMRWNYTTGFVGIGSSAPKAKLDVVGTISGSSLTIAGLHSCDTIDTDAQGNLVCGTDATGGSGAPEVGTASFSGAIVRLGNTQWVKKGGDTMTGALVINVTGGSQNTLGLRVINALSGAVIHAEKSLTTSGTLVFEGAASGSSLYIASSLQGVGLVDCDIAGTSKLLWDSSTGRFSCGTDTDTDTNTTYSAARGLTLNGTAFSLNSTITGALVRFTTISGSIITAKTSLASSGSLTWEGAASGATLWVSSFDGAGLTDCDLTTNKIIWDATLKRFSCGTDLNTIAWSNTGSILTAADSKYVNIGGDTMTGTLAINVTGGSQNTLGLRVINTASGAVFHAERTLSSSGTLVWEGAGSGARLWVSLLNVGSNINASGSILANGSIRSRGVLSGSALNIQGGTSYVLGNLAIGTSTPNLGGQANNAGLLTVQNAPGTLLHGVIELANRTDADDQPIGSVDFIAPTQTNALDVKTAGIDARLMGSTANNRGSALLFFTRDDGDSNVVQERMIIRSNGNVGIGAHGIDAKLEVGGSVSGALLTFNGIGTNYLLGKLGLGIKTPGSRLSVSGAVIIGNNIGSSAAKAQLDVKGTISGSLITQNGAGNNYFMGNVGIGTTSPSVALDIVGNQIAITRYSNSAAAPTVYNSLRARGTVDAPSAVQSGDALMAFQVNAYGATAFSSGVGGRAGLKVLAAETWTDTAQGTSMQFQTTPTGSTTVATAMTILGSGNVGIGTITPGSKFSISGAVVIGNNIGSSAAKAQLDVKGTISGSLITQNGAGNNYFMGNVGIGTSSPTNQLHINSSSDDVDLRLDSLLGGTSKRTMITAGSGGALRFDIDQGINGASRAFIINIGGTERLRMNSSGNLGIGVTTPQTKLEVLGTISGSALTIAGLHSCDSIDTDAQGNLVCGTDATGGSGAPEVGTASFSGAVVRLGNTQWVKKSGDTMTGALAINVTGGSQNTLGLRVINTASGAVFHAEKTLSSSGTLVWEGAGSGSSLYIASSLQGVGLADCDLSTQKLQWDITTGRFSCGNLTTFGSGNVITIGDSKYMNVGGDTMTGALAINVTGGSQNTLGLRVINTASGAVFHAEKTLSSSGTLVFEGAGSGARLWVSLLNVGSNINASGSILANGSIRARGTLSGAALVVSRNAVFSASGIIISTTGSTVFNEQSRNVDFRIEGDTDASLFYLDASADRIGIGKSDPKAKFDVVGTASGSKLFASNELSSSGILVIRSLIKAGSGAATIVPTEFQTGAYITGSGAAALALDTYTNTGSVTPHILFGYRGTFDAGLYRVGRPGSGALAIRVTNTQSTNAASAFEIYSNTTHTNNKVFRVAVNGATFSDGAYASTGADYAEWFMSKDNLLPGEVVCIDVTKKNSVKRCTNAADGNVMGVVSTNPSFIGNSIGGAEGIMPPGYVLVGLIGQVPAKVIVEGSSGAIRPGDSLTPASIAGYARKAKAGESTVGVALEGLSSGQGVVNVLISRRNQSLTVEAVEEKVLKTIASMEIEDEVQLMVSSALGDLNVDAQITDEVTNQINAITAQSASIQSITAEISFLKAQIAAMGSSTGTGAAGTDAINGVSTGAFMYASALEIDDTLITGGDARIGGDLSIDGTLNASSLFVPNGLTIDGGVVMNGLFDAEELHVSSSATIDGVLTINGTLNLGSGTTLNLGSGALALRQLLVEDSLFVMGDITIQGMATFLGNLNVRGELTVSGNQAGFAMIPATGTSVTVHFGTGFTGTPVVTASPDVPVLYAVSKSSATGFTIRIASPAAEDITFAWHALSTNAPVTIRAELTSEGTIMFPMASDNIPISSNMAWNACIRNITMLDDQGQPLSCGRYHEAYNWTHPDLGITFIWNTSLTPALLQLPEGYDAEVTEDVQGILDAINDGGSEIPSAELRTGSDQGTGSSTATGSIVPDEEPVIVNNDQEDPDAGLPTCGDGGCDEIDGETEEESVIEEVPAAGLVIEPVSVPTSEPVVQE